MAWKIHKKYHHRKRMMKNKQIGYLTEDAQSVAIDRLRGKYYWNAHHDLMRTLTCEEFWRCEEEAVKLNQEYKRKWLSGKSPRYAGYRNPLKMRDFDMKRRLNRRRMEYVALRGTEYEVDNLNYTDRTGERTDDYW